MGFARLASFALVGLVGCAGVLGFEDIVVDDAIAEDGGIDAPGSSSGTSGTSGTSTGTSGAVGGDGGPARCGPRSPFTNPQIVAELRPGTGADDRFDNYVRLSQDELTMTWTRVVTVSDTPTAMISTRSKRTDPWSAPAAFGGANVRAPAPSDDGLTFYFSFLVTTNNTGRIVSAPKNMLAQRTALALSPESDDSLVIRSDRTDETFFTSNRDPAAGTKQVGDGPYSIYRAAGALGVQPPAVTKVELTQDLALAGNEELWLLEPVLSGDGLDLYYVAFTTANGAFPVPRGAYVASRSKVGEPFGAGKAAPGIDIGRERLGWISPDGCRGYFTITDSAPEVAIGTAHIYVKERVPQ